ncbi:hypothetical protein AAMO2058_000313000 [Amorphochlora amoebiformis]
MPNATGARSHWLQKTITALRLPYCFHQNNVEQKATGGGVPSGNLLGFSREKLVKSIKPNNSCINSVGGLGRCDKILQFFDEIT